MVHPSDPPAGHEPPLEPAHVHRFIPAQDPDARFSLLLLHGTGGDENDLIPLAAMLAPGAPVLSVRGNVLENGMPRFFRRLAEGVFDLDDLHRRTADLARFLQAAAERYQLRDRPIVAVGFSNGANIAASLLLSRPDVLAGAVLLRAMVPFVPETAPDLAGTPVFLAGGSMDPLIPPADTQRLADLLESAGASLQLHWAPAGHNLTAGDVEAARTWLQAGFPAHHQSP